MKVRFCRGVTTAMGNRNIFGLFRKAAGFLSILALKIAESWTYGVYHSSTAIAVKGRLSS
jgi:hypothetical protein